MGRRIAKVQEQYERSLNQQGHTKPIQQETLYHWDGDVLAIETVEEESVHYVFEAESFKPFAQFKAQAVRGIDTPQYDPDEYRHYDPENRPAE